MRVAVRPRQRPSGDGPPGIARRRLLLPLSHADQLRRQRAAAQRHDRSGLRSRERRCRRQFQSHVAQRDRARVCHPRRADTQHRLGQERRLLHGVPQPRRDQEHAVSQPGQRLEEPIHAGAGTPAEGSTPRPGRTRHPRGARPARGHARVQRRRRSVPAVASRHRAFRASRAALVTAAPAGARRVPERGVQTTGIVSADGLAETRGLSPRAVDARGVLQHVPRRHQRADDQEQSRQVGRRLPDRADVRGVVEQPVRRSSGQPLLRSSVQARLPDLPYAAGLRPAGHGANALQGRRARPATRRRRGHGWPGAHLLQPPLHRWQRLRAGTDWRKSRRRRKRRALSRTIGLQLFVGRREERVLQCVLGEHRSARCRESAGAPRLGSSAQRTRSARNRTDEHVGGRQRAYHDLGDQQRQRS